MSVVGDKPVPSEVCISCRYDIAAMATESVCPECGASVQLSRETNQMFSASRRTEISRSITIIIACIIPCALIFAYGLTSYVSGGSSLISRAAPSGKGWNWIGWAMILLPQVGAFPAYWRYSTPRLSSEGTPIASTWGKAVRKAIITQLLIIPFMIAFVIVTYAFYPSGFLVMFPVSMILAITYALVWLRRTYAALRYSEEISLQLQGMKTAVMCRRAVWYVMAGALLAIAFTPVYVAVAWLYCRVLWRVRKLARSETSLLEEEAKV